MLLGSCVLSLLVVLVPWTLQAERKAVSGWYPVSICEHVAEAWLPAVHSAQKGHQAIKQLLILMKSRRSLLFDQTCPPLSLQSAFTTGFR